MSASSSTGPARTTRSSVRKNPIQIVKDPIIKKKVAKNSSKPKQINSNTMEEIHETEESQDMIYENQPEVIILSKDKGKNKEITTEQNVPFDKQSLENNPLGGNVDESEWTQTENSHHPDWRQKFNTKKYKIWTYASRIPGKNIGKKIEHVKKTLRQETELILVRSENNGKDKMISVLFDNKEKMQKAKKINVSENVELPAYMHAAQVYKSRPFNDNNKGVKLWDIPLGVKHNELKIELENLYGTIVHLRLIPTGMWQFAVVIFENEESEKNLLQQWSIIIGEDSFHVTSTDCNYNQLMERGKYAAQIINLPFGITAREIIPNIMTIKALTCYIPRTRNYRRKGEAIISNYDHQEEMDEDDDIPKDNNDPSIETTNVEPDKTDKLLNVVENIGQRISSLEDSLHSSKNNNRSHRIESWGSPSNQYDTIIDNTKTYHTWWTSKETQGSGSGVGIMVYSDIAQHVYKIDRFKARAICLYLSFNGKCTVQLIATYAPTQQLKYRNEIKELNK
ncbi:10749_t:CDS:2, partial [Diversispora eburnea]